MVADPYTFNDVLKAVQQYSLVQRNAETKTLSIHRVVQTVLKDEMNDTTQREWAERTICAVNCAFPNVEYNKWQDCQRCLPHAQACAVLIEQWNIVLPQAAQLLTRAGKYLTENCSIRTS